ncbi:uncharacterized protein BDW70DRAFT_166824 [Aspergillus foveolatus]|uniref:uncharacterized protein n=1 Tax=Aspergillus foveolatus TaxID=210207 RepID=UPI003CCDD860
MSEPSSASTHRPTSSACLACRQRKTKCDRRQPACSFCRRYDFECTYLPSQKAGLRAGYVSQLEKRIAGLEARFEAFQQEVKDCLPQRGHSGTEPAPASPALQQDTGDIGGPQSFPAAGAIRDDSGPGRDHPAPPSQKLTAKMAAEHCTIWFERYHPWFPILHQPSVVEYCQSWDPNDHAGAISLTVQAIVSVVLVDPTGDTSLTEVQRRKWSRRLRDEVLLAAMHNLSMEGLQALLIVSIVEYGEGRLSEFWNLMALCKRVSTQLGLRDLVAHHCQNFGVSLSRAPPRMLSIPATAIELEEKIRAFWAAEALDSVSTLGVAWNLGVSKPDLTASLPCSDDIWGFPESLISTYRFGGVDSPSCFSLFVRLITHDLWPFHDFLQQSYGIQSDSDPSSRQRECMAVDQHLIEWQRYFQQMLTVNTPPFTDLYSNGSQIQHPTTILIQCTVDSVIISLYQRYLIPAAQLDTANWTPEPWQHAADRCQQSCDHMAEVLRNASDLILQNINPLIIYSIFVAGRFSITFHYTVGAEIPSKTHFLIYALTVCGQRWPLARQLRRVLEAAMWERNASASTTTPLPTEFYDLQYHALDIAEALKRWAEATAASA